MKVSPGSLPVAREGFAVLQDLQELPAEDLERAKAALNDDWFVTGLALLQMVRTGLVLERHYNVVDDDHLPGRFQSLDSHKRLHEQGVCVTEKCKYCRFAGVRA